MPNPVEQELGLGPVLYGFRRWLRGLFAKLGLAAGTHRPLDPITVNYEAWRVVRKSVREWPHYQEAPNCLEVLVSRDDWDDYWGVDAARKEAGVSSYVRAQAMERGLWISGDPQVSVQPDDTLEVGEVEVRCQFVEPQEGEVPGDLQGTGSLGGLGSQVQKDAHAESRHVDSRVFGASPSQMPKTNAPADEGSATVPPFLAGQQAVTQELNNVGDPDTLRFISEAQASEEEAFLVGEGAFRLAIRPGDCVGAVREGDDVPDEVNLRLDASGFPYVEPMQFSLSIHDGRWAITNHAECGTKIVTHDGARFMLKEEEPFALAEGDVVWLGPDRPVRFERS